jgi:hypothetical protein
LARGGGLRSEKKAFFLANYYKPALSARFPFGGIYIAFTPRDVEIREEKDGLTNSIKRYAE